MEFVIKLNAHVPVYTKNENNSDMSPPSHRIDVENMLIKLFHTCDMGYYKLYGFEKIPRTQLSVILTDIDASLKESIFAYSARDLKQKMNERINKILLYIAGRCDNKFTNVYYKEHLYKTVIDEYIKN